MLSKTFPTQNAPIRRKKQDIVTGIATSLGLVVLLTGCGGGGGSTTPVPTPVPTPTPAPTPSPVVSPTPTPTPTPTLPAKDRAIAANFTPNYIPAQSARYLHWANNKNIRVFIGPSINNIFNKTPVNNIDAVRASAAVREALDSWTTSSTEDFRFTVVDRESDADIEIYFVDELRRLNGEVATGIGSASYSFGFPDSNDNTRGILENAEIQIVASQPATNLADTIAHEIGHSLGLESHSEEANDLLFAVSTPPTVITQRDQNSLFFLYYSPTAVSNQSATPSSRARTTAVGQDEIICRAR